MQPELSRGVLAAAAGGRLVQGVYVDPRTMSAGVELRGSSVAITDAGRRPVRDSVPSDFPPSRRPGLGWFRTVRYVQEGEVTRFGIVVLSPKDRPIRILIEWATARLAEEYARSLSGVSGYWVVTLQQVAVA